MKYCLECKQSFLRRERESLKRWNTRIYCSHECSNKSPERIKKCTKHLFGRKPPKSAFKKGDSRVIGAANNKWKGGKPLCLECGKQLSTRTAKRKPVVYCNKHKVRFGSEHHNWKGDARKKSEKKHLDSNYMFWATSVKKRDGWKCRIADENCCGRLESHHILNWIEYPEIRYEINNGITLCQAHHPKGRAKEKRLIPTFQELVSVSKAIF